MADPHTDSAIPALSEDDMITVLARVSEAADPWAALVEWLDERRRLNRSGATTLHSSASC